ANLKLGRMHGTLVFDMDSTNFNAYGHQEGVEFNGHYNEMGLHPFVVYEGRTGLLLDIELRSGAVYTSNNAENYLAQLLDHFSERSVVLRGDSGFATPKIYDMAADHGVDYVIRFKDNALLKKLPSLVVASDPDFTLDGKEHFYSFHYQSPRWREPHRLILVAKQNVEELMPTYQYFITSLKSKAETVVQFYRKRGQMENYIKETKSGFFADHVSSQNFFVNEARMMIACLAYNIMQLMKLLVFPPRQRIWQIGTIRTHLLDIAASVSAHARKTWINLTCGHPGLGLFWPILENIQRLQV
ncbi:IS1380 family transposase, partial [Schleiferilactobacillus shenzhenensis]